MTGNLNWLTPWEVLEMPVYLTTQSLKLINTLSGVRGVSVIDDWKFILTSNLSGTRGFNVSDDQEFKLTSTLRDTRGVSLSDDREFMWLICLKRIKGIGVTYVYNDVLG